MYTYALYMSMHIIWKNISVKYPINVTFILQYSDLNLNTVQVVFMTPLYIHTLNLIIIDYFTHG